MRVPQRRAGDLRATSSVRARRLRLVLVAMAGISAVTVVTLLGSSMSGGPTREQAPAWSPDGTTLVFEVERNGVPDVFVSRVDGHRRRALTSTPHLDERAPAFSADGRRVAFSSGSAASGREVVDVRSGRRTPAFQDAWHPAAHDQAQGRPPVVPLPVDGHDESWQADGSRVAFVTARRGRDEIFEMTADGRDLRPLVSMAGSDVSSPRWSPDGRRLAFVRTAHAGVNGAERAIYVLDVPSRRVTRVSP